MQLVLIAAGTKAPQNALGDLVARHEDDVDLSGPGYATFNIVKVEGFSIWILPYK